jgi:hypothetical protein
MERGEPGTLEYFRWFYLGDWSEPGAVEERWDPGLVLHQSHEVLDTAGAFHGYEGLRQAFDELEESFKGIVWEPVEVRELGEGRYLVRVVASGSGRGSDIPYAGELGHAFTLRDGRATQLDVHWKWEDALKAEGLS